jgi:hypothetical protein
VQGNNVADVESEERMRDTIDMARQVYGAHTEWSGAPLDRLEQLVALVRADEREACAKVCDKRYMGDNNREDMEAKRCAAAIRNRGNI